MTKKTLNQADLINEMMKQLKKDPRVMAKIQKDAETHFKKLNKEDAEKKFLTNSKDFTELMTSVMLSLGTVLPLLAMTKYKEKRVRDPSIVDKMKHKHSVRTKPKNNGKKKR